VAWSAGKLGRALPTPEQQTGLAYGALVALSFIYFCRPEDYIPGLGYIPIAKIAGGISLLALIFGVSGQWRENKPRELRLLYMLYFWWVVGLPFSSWRGNSIKLVFTDCLKCVIVVILVSLVVNSLKELRRLLWLQATAVTMNALGALLIHKVDMDGRLEGLGNGALFNPNDLAINIALNWPICIAFFFMPRGLKKGLWAFAVVIMLIGVELTYSRSGFLAVALAAVLVVWQFAIRERKFQLVLVAGFLGMIVMVAMPSHFVARIGSIVTGNQVDSMDRGSMQERKNLLIASVNEALHNPVFGVGAGNFQATAGSWHVAHNTYTEIAAEAGFPAAVLFLMILYRTVVNLRLVRKSRVYATDADVRMLAGGLWVSVAAYLVSAFFASTEYSLYPYFLVAYTTALYQITSAPEETAASPARTIGRQSKYGRTGANEPVWIR